MVDCLSWHSFYGSLRSSKSYVKGNRILSKPTIGKSNLSFTNHDTQLDKKQCNSNNNNNNGTLQSADESNVFLEFFIFNISRERSIHLCKNTNDKRLLSFYNISNGLYKNGVRNGDILIFLNGTNIIKPPIALTIDRVKSEFTALRRQNKPIQIGICRCVDRSIFNNATVQHLGSLTIHEFENLSRHEESNEIHKSTTIVHSESKKLLSLFSNKKKLISNGKRKSILDKTNEIDQRNLSSNSMKHENEILTVKTNEDKNSFITQQSTKKTIEHVDTHTDKESKESTSNRNLSTQIFTDACFIYRRQVIKHPQDTNAMILRGREIAHEAANSPTIPSSMPNYSHDQIRELYGEIDKKTRRLKENQYIFHTPMIDAWNETPPWSVSSTSSLIPNQCPLPKFRLDKNDETIFMATYFSTGLSNRRTLSTTDDKDIIRGSFRTSVGERTSVSPSPLLLNVRFDYKKLNSPEMIAKDESNVIPDYIQSYSTEQSTEPLNHINSSSSSKLDPLATKNVETMDIDSLIDLDDQTAISYHTDKESQMDLELDSLFSRKNQPTTCVHSQSIDVTPRMKPNDLFKTITSPDDSCYYDALTSSIQSSIFSDNFFEQVETLNHINKIEKLSSKQIDGDVSIDNLSEIIREINQTPSCINHLVFAYDHQSIQPQGADAVSNDQMEITNTKTLSQQSSIEPEIPSTNTNIYQESLSSDDENNYRQITSDIDEDFEELYQRYLTNLNQYQKILEQIDQVEQKLSPIDEEINSMNEHVSKNQTQLNSSNVILSVKRQSNHIGHYGFELEQTFEGKIKISSIIDSTYCPNLNVGDEILGINNIATLTILEQYYLLFNTLWHNQYEYIDLTIKKTVSSSTLPHSNILSWSIPKVESDLLIDTNNITNNKMQDFDNDFTKSSTSSYSSYKSQIGPRTTNVQRRAGGPPGIMTRMYQSYSTSGGSGGFSAGGMGGGISNLASIAGLGNFAGIPLRPNRGSSALVAVNETREKEKRELCQLNDKFAQYVEKVRFLEAQNRKLQLELEALQNKAGQGSSKIKEMYEVEMSEAKKLIDDTTRDRAAAEVKARDAEKEAGRYRKRYEEILNSRETDRSAIDRLQQQIAENEAQINLFRRRLADLEDEARRYKAETQRLASEIARLQNEIQNETFVKSSLDTEKMALEDELAMLKQMHEADLNELRSKTVVDVNLDPSHFFRNELAQAIRDIRNEFEALNDQQRADLHNRYMMSYNELILRHQKPDLDPIQSEQQRIQEEKLRTTLLTTRNEVAHMKARNEELNNRIRELQLHIDQERDDGSRLIQKRASEIDELRRKLEQLKKEYEEVTNMKTSLEKEINTYRELLEGTNNRDGLKQIVDHVVEEARRMEAERATGGGIAGSIAYSGGGRQTTISRTFIASSGSSATNAGISGIVGSPGRSTASYSGGQGNVSGSFSQTSSRREYTGPS